MSERNKWRRRCAGLYECGSWRIERYPLDGKLKYWLIQNAEWADERDDSDILDEEAMGLWEPGEECPTAPTYKQALALAEKLMADDDASRSRADAVDLSIKLTAQAD